MAKKTFDTESLEKVRAQKENHMNEKVAIITAAGQGIGPAIGRDFSSAAS